MRLDQECLGKYEYTSIAGIVAARLQDFEVIQSMIEEAAKNPTLAISTRITELEAIKEFVQGHIDFLKKFEKRKKQR